MTNQPVWKKFWFETNQAFGPVDSAEDWSRMKSQYDRAYPGCNVYDLKEAGGRDKYPIPSFGQRREHTGDRTLGEFFKKNGMNANKTSKESS